MTDLMHFEDFAPGATFDCGDVRLSAEEIVAFARLYDPQPFHLDSKAAERSPLRGLAASGWHTCSAMMRGFYDGVIRQATGQGSPGVSAIRWLSPARPDRQMRMTASVVETRASNSRPGLGLVTFDWRLDDGDAAIATLRCAVMMLRQGAEPPRAASPTPMTPASSSSASVAPSSTVAPQEAGDWFDFEMLKIDQAADLGAETFTADEIITFARQFDPQPFHLDPDAARNSVLGGLCASGWHSAGMWMRRYVASVKTAIAALPPARRAAAATALGPALGIEDLRWRQPIYAGETVRFFMTPREKRIMASRPGWALVRADNLGVKESGATALQFSSLAMLRITAA